MENPISGQSTLGNLAILPPELRCQVYGYVLPEAFQQRFVIDNEHGTIAALNGKAAPSIGLLYASRAIRNEAEEGLTRNDVWKVNITEHSLASNMPLCDRIFTPKIIISPTCKSLDLTVAIPCPRTPAGLFALRIKVQIFVDWLNPQPKLPLQLAAGIHSKMHGLLEYTYNDYAMLMGPLGALSGVQKPRIEPFVAGRAAVEQCQLITAAMCKSTSDDGKKLARRQQLLIDVKLSLALYQDRKDLLARLAFIGGQKDDSASVTFGQRGATVILDKINQLIDCTEADAEKENWKLLKSHVSKGPGAVLPKELVRHLLDLEHLPITEYMCWAEGIMTRYNPIW
jgi:hypothetical protein